MTRQDFIHWLASCQHNATTFSLKNLVDKGRVDDKGGCYLPPEVVSHLSVHFSNPYDMRSSEEISADLSVTSVFYKDILDYVDQLKESNK